MLSTVFLASFFIFFLPDTFFSKSVNNSALRRTEGGKLRTCILSNSLNFQLKSYFSPICRTQLSPHLVSTLASPTTSLLCLAALEQGQAGAMCLFSSGVETQRWRTGQKLQLISVGRSKKLNSFFSFLFFFLMQHSQRLLQNKKVHHSVQMLKLNSWLEVDTPLLLYFNNRIKYSAVIQLYVALGRRSSDATRKADCLSLFLVTTLIPITTTWLETMFESPMMKPGGGASSERGRHSQSFHIRCQLSQRGIVGEILKCFVFAFVPSEPILVTF